MNNLSNTIERLGRYGEAEVMKREVLEARRVINGPRHHSTLVSMTNLSNTLGSLKRYAEAEEMQREVLEARREVSGPRHPDTLR